MNRYVENFYHPYKEGKNRMYYEYILTATSTADITSYPDHKPGVEKSYSKFYLKKIISPYEWGISPFRSKELIIPRTDIKFAFNYYDYIDAFTHVFYYENKKHGHTWWVKLNPEIFKNSQNDKLLPGWIFPWWNIIGPEIQILPTPYINYYKEWIQLSPCITPENPSLGFSESYLSESVIWNGVLFCIIRKNIFN